MATSSMCSPYKTAKRGKKQNSTPSKRTVFKAVFEDNDIINTDNIHESIQSVKEAYMNGTEATSANDLISALTCSYGIEFVVCFLGALCHVPTTFMNRIEYIYKIISSVDGRFQKQNIEKVSTILHEPAQRIHIPIHEDVLWQCTIRNNEGFLKFLVPPVNKCIHCDNVLYALSVTQITFFTLSGPLPGMKTTTRCKKGCGAIYNVDRYSLPGKGTYFYKEILPVVSASNCVYVSREVHELMCEAGNHAFVSHHGFSEIYNALFRTSTNGSKFREWTQSANLTSHVEDTEITEENALDDLDDIGEDPSVSQRDETEKRYYLTRKKAISAYFNGELTNEIQDREITATLGIGVGETREDLMKNIDNMRRQELYHHKLCSNTCKDKGCDTLRVIDSCWKVCMPHCMYAVEMEVKGMPLLTFPNVCTAEPKPKSVFCHEHHTLLEQHGIPTKKEDFLKYIGCKENPTSTDDIDTVDKKTLELSREIKIKSRQSAHSSTGAADYQGTADMVSIIDPLKWQEDKICNKDTGQKSRLRQRSRGHFICVTGGGHIQYFEPIFKSESPSQVFMIVLRVMVLEFSKVPEDQLDKVIENYVLSYDNMCQLDSLRASKEPLPFPAPYDIMWTKITKIIDRLHIKNHKNPRCKEVYDPAKIPQQHNTMIAEQTFAWFSRFKKVVNSMNQAHHLFYIHRNIKRRNAYTEMCRITGRSPLLPGINVKIKLRS